MRTTNRLTKVAAMAAALAAVSTVALVSSAASALPAGTAATSGQNLAQASGTGTSSFQLTLTSNGSTLAAGTNTCPGDGIAGYKWTSYMVPASVDVATLTYNSGGPIAPSGVAFAQPLFSSSGSPQVSKSPGLGDGLVTVSKENTVVQ